MAVTLAQLEAFHWIARLGSFHAAADYLHLAQPTVSVRIRALEQQVGARLFEREGRAVRLTGAGAELAEKAERLLAIAGDISGRKAAADPLKTRLRLGAPDSFAMVCLPMLLRLMEREYPDLKVALTVENSAVLNQKLNDRELDIAFLVSPELAGHVRSQPLGRQDIAWVASPRLGLAGRLLRPADLARFQVFTNPEPSRLIVLVRDWFARSGIDTVRISTCNSMSVIIRLTVAGTGVSLLPTAILRSELKTGALQRLDTAPSGTTERLFAAYQAGEPAQRVATVLALARRVLARTRFLLA